MQAYVSLFYIFLTDAQRLLVVLRIEIYRVNRHGKILNLAPKCHLGNKLILIKLNNVRF